MVRMQFFFFFFNETLGRKELRSHGSLNYFLGAFLPGFIWPVILICLVLSLYSV